MVHCQVWASSSISGTTIIWGFNISNHIVVYNVLHAPGFSWHISPWFINSLDEFSSHLHFWVWAGSSISGTTISWGFNISNHTVVYNLLHAPGLSWHISSWCINSPDEFPVDLHLQVWASSSIYRTTISWGFTRWTPNAGALVTMLCFAGM